METRLIADRPNDRLLAMERKADVTAESITNYIKGLDPKILGEHGPLSIGKIERIGSGTRHFNYRVTVNSKQYLMRFSLTNHPEDHVRYEHDALLLFPRTGLAPRPYFYETSKEHTGFPFLMVEYVEGSNPSEFTDGIIRDLARTVAELHSLEVSERANRTLRRKVSKEDILEAIKGKIDHILMEKNYYSGGGTLEQVLSKGYERLEGIDIPGEMQAVMSHGDIALPNIVVNPRLRLIDWETMAITEPGYDIASLYERSGLSKEQRALFLSEYLRCRHDPYLSKKLDVFVKLREFDRLCWAIWEAFDVQEGAKGGFYPEWRSASVYTDLGRRKFDGCVGLGLIDNSPGWDSMGVEAMLDRAGEQAKRLRGYERK